MYFLCVCFLLCVSAGVCFLAREQERGAGARVRNIQRQITRYITTIV